MFHFSTKLFILIVIFSCLFFYLVSCGGNTAVSVSPTPSGEFQQFVSDGQKMTPEEFVTWWNDSERYNGWIFSYYGQNGLAWPDLSGAEQIFTSKLLNCYRMTVLLQAVYGGEIVYVTQEDSQYDHCYLRLTDGKIDNCGLVLKWIEF